MASPGASRASVQIWLWLVYALIFVMVLLGGTTRLTGSGLSMVEWHPLMGTLPPGSEQEWQRIFSLYKLSPQFLQVNAWMDLEAFKRIFFLEYVHRLLGRLLGVAVVVPCLYFVARRRLSHKTTLFAFVAILLGALQGVFGWYMVKSGLVGQPEVSHYRLAAHLLLALICSQWILWMLLELNPPWGKQARPVVGGKVMAIGLLALLYLQMMYGAFVAGKRAGAMSTTFPDMNGQFGPPPLSAGASLLHNLLTDPLVIHYVHRVGAFLVAAVFVAAGIAMVRSAAHVADRKLGQVLLMTVGLQFVLGALTVVSVVSIPLAVAHQGGAFLLTGAVTAHLHRSLWSRTL